MPKGFARTQSPQNVLIGIENLLYFYKYRLFYKLKRAICFFVNGSFVLI
ncbi:hypothetical protein EUBSIR_00886 [[Eubacterium] siraeum DSM 15702]|uniref:Uncharacterized protein n=1 Tax=[Eubacterium] siraeum DSM 15702 TaxID=428128 RepID=B0MM37_9FIRM|nr:hypothetical protein EUBSIR_00886 [[Eubacterium] siraeum DSM 15702]